MDSYLGQIILFSGSYAPVNWAVCDGHQLSVSQYPALFSLLGTQFGGNGTTTFGLPDLRSRLAMGFGTGHVDPKASNSAPLTPYGFATNGGVETVTLTQAQIPPHTHTLNASGDPVVSPNPSGGVPASFTDGTHVAYFDTPNPIPSGMTITPKQLGASMVTTAGASQPHENRMPYLGLMYIIRIEGGIFPTKG
ncbi:phage tail protein [Paramagnetospirillum magneticum]|uniref:Microcystin-dependent protein n=1 Tax=Paramagnetospirillum magneticum (strain ATCC 700264 / AMB-1) TaxID=342108 RepID=Q2W7B2_PARM1|nr:tail fiber protein [Paramagnetospirillum magneticum]BAE50263.1 Microcystin-dependent protein [Paramagnetospirillum magneticum AMB-1]